MKPSISDILSIARLTQAGHLMDATRAIQKALAPDGGSVGNGGFKAEPVVADARHLGGASASDVIDVEAHEVLDVRPTPEGAEEVRSISASFTVASFLFGGEEYRYRLFVPRRAELAAPLPVIVLLHGCQQDSADFARGTAMNILAERDGFMVLYPEQLRSTNSMGCWNWFEPAHQRRGTGEPAMIAALVQHVVHGHRGDGACVYVAGLSAGGAMAALLGEDYPDVFAGIGVHSGLPARAARDVPTALMTMRKGVATAGGPGSAAVPTVVFHGSGDKTVSSKNADAIVERALATLRAQGCSLVKSETAGTGGSRRSNRTRWSDPDGAVMLELWTISGGPHAWSGGDAAGSFTDPSGPDASEAMVRFFLAHRLR